MNSGPGNWTASLTKAVGTLVVLALVLFIEEPIFMHALPGLILVLVLIGIYRVMLGLFRSSGW